MAPPAIQRIRWQVFGLTWLAYGSFYLARKALAVVKVSTEEHPELEMALHFTLEQFGILDSGDC